MKTLLILCGFFFYFIGILQFLKPESKRSALHSKPGMPILHKTTPAEQRAPMKNLPVNLKWIQLNTRITIEHPAQGKIISQVSGIVSYQELWQVKQSGWKPTGNLYAAFYLDNGFVLLNWQNRYYILNPGEYLSDVDIQKYFMPYARQFGESNQTTDVIFSYPPAVWRIVDIGRFNIYEVSGSVSGYFAGSAGRFIHSSGDNQRALVVEDYQNSTGQDMVWSGYQIEEKNIQNN